MTQAIVSTQHMAASVIAVFPDRAYDENDVALLRAMGLSPETEAIEEFIRPMKRD